MYYYHHYHFADDTGRLSDQDGIVGGQMEMHTQVSWMLRLRTLLGITHTTAPRPLLPGL